MESGTIRVLVADDHPVVREGLRRLIDAAPDLTVVALAADGVEAVHRVALLQPDVVVLDLVMPRMDGLEAIQAIRRETPAVRILVLSAHAEAEQAVAAIQAGAQSYLLKEVGAAPLLQAIRNTHRGVPVLHPTIAHLLIHRLYHPLQPHALWERLTEREREVLQLLGQGHSNHQIAARLVISPDTTRTHVSNILHKLHLENRTAAARWAVGAGLGHAETHP